MGQANYRAMTKLDLSMTADYACKGEVGSADEDKVILQVGDKVEYRGHVVGGMVRVRWDDGREAIVHPHCFPQLRG